MILADTSVWVRAFMNRSPWKGELDRVLEAQAAAGHELVYGELLAGNSGKRSASLAAYARLPFASTLPHQSVVALVSSKGLNGRGVGWIDLHLLATAVTETLSLWTADAYLQALAEELGVAYHFPA